MGILSWFGLGEEEVTARTPLNLQVGDIVEYDLVDYEVAGKIEYQEGSYVWYDYHLVDGEDSLWLYAEDDDRLQLALFSKVAPGHQVYDQFQSGYPGQVKVEGKKFSLVEKGRASITVTGQVGAKTGQQVEYADYKAEDGTWLSVEKWGSQLEISRGQEVKESLLNYYPGEEGAK